MLLLMLALGLPSSQVTRLITAQRSNQCLQIPLVALLVPIELLGKYKPHRKGQIRRQCTLMKCITHYNDDGDLETRTEELSSSWSLVP